MEHYSGTSISANTKSENEPNSGAKETRRLQQLDVYYQQLATTPSDILMSSFEPSQFHCSPPVNCCTVPSQEIQIVAITGQRFNANI